MCTAHREKAGGEQAGGGSNKGHLEAVSSLLTLSSSRTQLHNLK